LIDVGLEEMKEKIID